MQKHQGVVRDERGQDQPKTKEDAQHLGVKEQKEAAKRAVSNARATRGRRMMRLEGRRAATLLLRPGLAEP
jgi:hypothetical protein